MEEKNEISKLIVDVENFELCSIEKHRENLIRLRLNSYTDLERLFVNSTITGERMFVYCWNPAQSKYLVKDEDGCQHMCNPFTIERIKIPVIC